MNSSIQILRNSVYMYSEQQMTGYYYATYPNGGGTAQGVRVDAASPPSKFTLLINTSDYVMLHIKAFPQA